MEACGHRQTPPHHAFVLLICSHNKIVAVTVIISGTVSFKKIKLVVLFCSDDKILCELDDKF